jgi:peptidoglycan/xylan/chitin deacetylase (PgdA/CDA1 family)
VDGRFVTRARELDRARPLRRRARTALRRAALTALALRQRPPAPGLRIVHYHFVFDDELESFRRQLAYLAAEFEPVSLTQAVDRLRERRSTGREIAVTFDDGFRNQLTNAAPLLSDAGFSACFYLITDLVSATERNAVRICRELLHLPRPVEPLTWDDATALLVQGHEVGSHTVTHPNLAALAAARLTGELRVSKELIEQRLGPGVAHFSAPYGDAARFSPAISEAARAAGYASCATAIRGPNATNDVYALRRDHVVAGWPVRDLRYFLAR